MGPEIQKRKLGNCNLEVSAIEATSIEFTPEELREIEDTSSKIKVLGDRYPEHLQKQVSR